MTTPTHPPSTIRLLRIGAVCADTSLSRSALYRLLRESKFPRPLKITDQAIAWPDYEVQAWIAGRIAARDAENAADTSVPDALPLAGKLEPAGVPSRRAHENSAGAVAEGGAA